MKSFFYRTIMEIAHKYHWHYAPPVYPDGETMLWCQWCGFRAKVEGEGVAGLNVSEFCKPRPSVDADTQCLKSCCKLAYAAGWWAGIDKYKEQSLNSPNTSEEGK